jgi:ABC-2 type transport system permease protein
LSDVFPLTYAVEAMQHITRGEVDATFGRDAAIIALASALALAVGAATLRRRTP